METQTLETTQPTITPEDITESYLAEQKDQWIVDFIHEKNARVFKYIDRIRPEHHPAILITFTHTEKLPVDLPQGYCFMGGVARNVVLRELNEQVNPPRDIDIVAIDEFRPNLDFADPLSRQYMPEDFKHGYGISFEYIREYFFSRDFNVNEVLVNGQDLYITEEALLGLRNKVIKPTDKNLINKYFYENQGVYGFRSKLPLKALSMALEMQQLYGKGNISGIAPWQFELENISPFMIALFLNKAKQRGDTFLARYFQRLMEIGIVVPMKDYDKPEQWLAADTSTELALRLQSHLVRYGRDEKPFIFDNEEWNKLAEEYDDSIEKEYTDDEYYADLANYYDTSHRSTKPPEY